VGCVLSLVKRGSVVINSRSWFGCHLFTGAGSREV
jgi:hypothetical protein